MKRWHGFGWYTPAQKKPPPKTGIKMKKAGTTWWGQRWIQALEDVLRGDALRLARGRTYARAGRTHYLVVTGGKVTAKVTGSRATPYTITIEIAQLGETAWRTAISGMALKSQFSAELLAGEMPQAIDEVFAAAGVSLFPKQRADLVTTCSCPDWGDPCKHVAATHYVLGEALDRDPFLLFELRGKSKAHVLEALRAARGAADGPPRKGRANKDKDKDKDKDEDGDTLEASPDVRSMDAHEGATVMLRPPELLEYDTPREVLPSLRFTFDEPLAHGSVLRQLGAPASWDGKGSPADVFGPRVRAAAEVARRIAMAEPLGDAPAGHKTAGLRKKVDQSRKQAAEPRDEAVEARKKVAKRRG